MLSGVKLSFSQKASNVHANSFRPQSIEYSHSLHSLLRTIQFLMNKIMFHPTFTCWIFCFIRKCYITEVKWVLNGVSCWHLQRKERENPGFRVVKSIKSNTEIQYYKKVEKHGNSPWWHISERGHEIHLPAQGIIHCELHPSMTMDGHLEMFFFPLNHKPISKRLLWLATWKMKCIVHSSP